MHVIAAKAVAFKEALQPSYKKYAEMVVSNAQTLSDTLIRGPHFTCVSSTRAHITCFASANAQTLSDTLIRGPHFTCFASAKQKRTQKWL